MIFSTVARRLLLGVIATLAVGCGAGGTPAEQLEDESAVTEDGWQSLGTGVAYKRDGDGDGDGVFIGYAGWSVRDSWTRAWSQELSRARLKELGIGHLYAVRGPEDVGYERGEIKNSKLLAHLVNGISSRAPIILIAAHSSGSYVAHELLGILERAGTEAARETLHKTVYVNLDGGGQGLTPSIVGQLRDVAFVWAEDTTIAKGVSANASTMDALGRAYGKTRTRIVSDHTGCDSGARWCLHDAVITTRPHDPAKYDLANDYTDFVDRPVQTGWIDVVAGSLTRTSAATSSR